MTSYVYYVSLGSNVGDRTQHLQDAIHQMDALSDTRIVSISHVYETDPVELVEQPRFLNVVAEVHSAYRPPDLLSHVLTIEAEMGRVRTIRYGPRCIDIDLLLCGSLIIDTETLTLPHPRMHERAFVLVPLAEIAPSAIHPVLKQSIASLCEAVSGKEGVQWYPIHLQSDCGRIVN